MSATNGTDGARRPAHPDNRVQLELYRLREQERQHTADLIARWRKEHPTATCSDKTALALAEMAASIGRF